MLINKYSKYKNSQIQWINKIPLHWKLSKVKHHFIIKNKKANEKKPTILSLARDGIKIRDISTGEGQIAESYYNYNSVDPGDLLLNPMDLYSGDNCNISKVKGVISPAYINLKNKKKIESSYYNYYFKLQYWFMTFFSFGKGVSEENRWTLNTETILNYIIPVPPFEEQKQIANYLDNKTSKIDQLIIKNKKLIDLLEEKRTSLINQVVTKGLNPNVKMKDSGIEWIGQIPEHWKLSRLKFNISKKAQYGANKEPEKNDEKLDVRYIRITDIDDNGFLKDSKVYLSKEDAKEFLLNENDILFARSGATVGKAYLHKNNLEKCCFAGYLIRYVPSKTLNSKFLLYFTLSKCYWSWIHYVSTQATIENVSADKYNELILPIPPLIEQENINEYLDNQTKNIDKTIEKVEKEIELLEEYKKSLIYNVVTGKVDIRGVDV